VCVVCAGLYVQVKYMSFNIVLQKLCIFIC